MHISGSGSIAAGIYEEELSVSGSARIEGDICAKAFSCSGSVRAKGSLECREKVRVSGSFKGDGAITARSIHISGSCKTDGDCTAKEELHMSGSISCTGMIKGTDVQGFGSVCVQGGIEAEDLHLAGVIRCDNLINAERIDIEIDGNGSYVGSIGGSHITVTGKKRCLLSRWLRREASLTVKESIEGDTLTLDSVCVDRAVGRIVTVGAHAEIGLVQYTEHIDIHPKAKVARVEKI